MNSNKLAKVLVAACATVGVLWSGMALAIDWNITGFVRQEIGISITAQENQNNQMSDDSNGLLNRHFTNPTNSPTNATKVTGLGYSGKSQLATPSGAPAALFSLFRANLGAVASSLTNPGGLSADINNSLTQNNCRFGSYNMREIIGQGITADPDVTMAPFASNSVAFTAPGPLDALNEFGSEGFHGIACPDSAGSITRVGGLSDNQLGAGGTYIPGSFSPQGVAHQDDFDVTMFNTRAEVDVQAKISRSFAAYAKFRAYFWSEDTFTDGRVGDHFSQHGMFHGGTSGNILEASTADLLLDIPALYVDYNKGPLWLRVGQQTIAWGEAYFFRVMDTANGLDLRRQLIGVAAEEFSDQRVASPAIRLSYTFDNSWEIDAFAQMFSPTLLPAQNTPYNVVNHATSFDEEDEFEDAENAINFGFRLTAPVTDSLTLLAAYTNRRDPNGVFRYTDAPRQWAGQENPFCLGSRNDTFQLLNALQVGGAGVGGALEPLGPGAASGSGVGMGAGILAYGDNGHAYNPVTLGLGNAPVDGSCGSPLAPDPWALNSTEFVNDVGDARLSPVDAIRVVVDEWEADELATRQAFGFAPEFNMADAISTAEGFHSSFGAFRSWVTREFKREQIFMFGGNYIVNSENEWLDQLIVRGEVAITPDKKFTSLGLSYDFIEETEVVSALILEKYQRFSDRFPATYIVAQWMFRKESDIFGRHLSGMEGYDVGDIVEADGITFNSKAYEFYKPKGQDNANYVAFAIQQPFPNLIWRFDFAMLIDVQGGVLFQPGVRYRPSADWQFDFYATVVEDLTETKYDTAMESLDFNDEIFARITWFF